MDHWLALAAPLPVILAHVLYGIPSVAQVCRRVTLHNGDDFSLTDEAPRPDRLRSVRAVTPADERSLTPEGTREAGVAIDVGDVPAPGWVVVETTPSFIELAPDAFARYLVHEGLRDVLAQRAEAGTATRPGREIYSKAAKVALFDNAPTEFVAGPIGLAVELVPDPGPVAVGVGLRARLLVDGHPAPGRQVRIHHRPDDGGPARDASCHVTGAAGEIAFTIDAPGLWRLHAIDIEAHVDPAEADWRSRWASLTFRV